MLYISPTSVREKGRKEEREGRIEGESEGGRKKEERRRRKEGGKGKRNGGKERSQTCIISAISSKLMIAEMLWLR